MKKTDGILVLSGILVLLLAASAWGQPMGGAGKGRMGAGGGMGMMYDPKTVETVSGEVTQVQEMQGMAAGVHLELKTDKETLMVILGPASYLEQQKVKIARGTSWRSKGPGCSIPRRPCSSPER